MTSRLALDIVDSILPPTDQQRVLSGKNGTLSCCDKRPYSRQISYRVLLSCYNNKDSSGKHRGKHIRHIKSMPTMSPSPLLEPKCSTLSKSADFPFPLLLDEADRACYSTKTKYSLTLQDLDVVQLIGTGMYSKVYLVQSKMLSGDYFALKVMPKYKVKSKKPPGKTESEIMLYLDHPLIVKTWNTFEDEKNIYMLMDFAVGGELFYHLKEKGKFDENTARFYTAEIVLALEYMHNNNIAFRDLKLENLVLSETGHIQLTDFGFAKELDETRTYTLCGTPEYLAPEIIRGGGYGLSVDWWALGVLIFEMLAGYSPFYSGSPIDIYKNILRGGIRFSSSMSETARDLIKGLLTRDSTKRLGTMQNGVSDIRNHPFFDGIDWDTLTTKTPPIVPDINGLGDTKYFKGCENDGADTVPNEHDDSEDSDDSAALGEDFEEYFSGF